ncbi:bacteriorhodopsin [Lewinella sp. IMCC34191]|uniref:bacteriorhodopsin n=1 Tax=Lewinella sp. IMCC34191 TaxID=2259172 RepID=UPI000E2665EC|nr:bacteriorhodopsin [Lewinella sp. IMCC34191]
MHGKFDMDTSTVFLPTAATSGLLATMAWYSMVVSMFSLLASFLFSAQTRTHVAPEHNTSRVLTACIGLVAGISYYFIQDYYRSFLATTGGVPTYAESKDAFLAIGQLRYMDWTITTPLLLIKMFMMAGVRKSRGYRLLAIALLGDVWMIVTGYIGDQQVAAGNEILVGPRLVWGAVSTIGYLAVVYALFRVWKENVPGRQPVEQRAFRYIALTVVTLWGVYPIGYILIAVTGMNPDVLQIAFSVADIINKVGVGIVVYLAGSTMLTQRIDIQSREYAMNVG